MLRKNKEDVIINIAGYTFMLLFAAFCLIPFVLIISGSFTDEMVLMSEGFSLFPKKISTVAYNVLFEDNTVFDAYKVTIFISVVGTICQLLITSAMSYVLSIRTFAHRNKIAFFVYFTMLFNGGLVPTYILVTKYLNLQDNLLVYIIPLLVNPFNMFLLRNFFRTIPDSLSESAKLDGANDIMILFRIILPLSKPALATIGLFYALANWNEWFNCLLYVSDEKLQTLQYMVMKIMRYIDFLQQAANFSQGMSMVDFFLPPTNAARMATAAVTIGPIIFVYPFIQKYFIRGLVVGAVKG